MLRVVLSNFRGFEALFWKLWLMPNSRATATSCLNRSVYIHILKDILKSALISTFYCDCQCTCGFYLFWHFLFSNILQFALLAGGIYLKLQILGNRWDEWRFNSERGASSLVNFTVYQLLKFSESPVWVTGILSVRPWFLVSESAKYLTGLKALASRS